MMYLNFYPGMTPDNHKRFCLYDALGYYKSYKTRRMAMQAMKSLDPPLGWVWKLVDKCDNSVSYIKEK